MGENNREWKYDAFISYRHLEPDAFVAGSLHKILESYKVPGNLLKSNGEKLKRTKINKVFRDAEELPLTSNLNDTIMEALENSEYLIAICSPKFGESLWCKKEVDTFIKLRGKDHVLTVLVDGEPSESFPEELLYREIEVTLPDGTVKKDVELVEPLAANARGANNKERYKLLKTEALRLMAPMFGCSFDDLKQRHREQRMKRTIRIIGGVAAVCLAFGVVSTTMALKINSQNEQIVSQNEQIMEQADQIEAQYKEALVNNANSVGDYARTLFESGDRIGALENAYSVYPGADNDNPYVGKVEYVLSDALDLYANGRMLKPDRIIKCEAEVQDVILSPEGSRLVCVDVEGAISVWDTKNGKMIDQFYTEKNLSRNELIVFKDENTIIYANDEQVFIRSLGNASDEAVIDAKLGNIYEIAYSADKDRLFITGLNGVKLCELATGREILKVDYCSELFRNFFGEDTWFISCMGSSGLAKGRDEYVAVACTAGIDGDVLLCVYDTMTGELIGYDGFADVTINSMKCYKDKMIIAVNNTMLDGLDTSGYVSDVIRYSYENGLTREWTKTFNGMFITDVSMSLAGEGEKVACQSYDKVTILNSNDGSLKCQMEADASIVKLYGYTTSDYFSVVTRDGKWLAVSDDTEMLYDSGFWLSNSSNLKAFAAAECCVAVPYFSKEVTLYTFALSEGATKITEEHEYAGNGIMPDQEMKEKLDAIGVKGSFVEYICYDNTNKYMGVAYKNKTVDIVSIDSEGNPKSVVSSFEDLTDTFIDNICISPDGKYMIMSGVSAAYLLRINDVDWATTYPGDDHIVAKIIGFRDVDFDAGCVYVADSNQYYRIPLYDTEKIGELAKEALNNSIK